MKRAAAMVLCVLLLVSALPVRAWGAEGKSAVLMELTTGQILGEKNGHQKLAPASVTKVMTMLLIMEAIDSGRIRWSDPVTASETAAAKGGSQVYLKVGETMTVSDMMKAIAVSSANDCACAMAEHLCGSEAAFVGEMNRRARELGMLDTNFVNCTGLDDSREALEHRTSAVDIAIMSRELLLRHPDIRKYTTIWMDTLRNGTFGLSNTNNMVRYYKGTTGLKTGYTRGAGFCLSASARREDLELIAVVMGADSSRDRFGAAKSILDYGFANFALAAPELPEKPRVPVALGRTGTVAVKLGEAGGLVVKKTQRAQIRTRVELPDRVSAPVLPGQQLGMLTVTSGDQVLRQIPLVAEAGVERLGYGSLLYRILGGICSGDPQWASAERSEFDKN